jgi:hypothetical protein
MLEPKSDDIIEPEVMDFSDRMSWDYLLQD